MSDLSVFQVSRHSVHDQTAAPPAIFSISLQMESILETSQLINEIANSTVFVAPAGCSTGLGSSPCLTFSTPRPLISLTLTLSA